MQHVIRIAVAVLALAALVVGLIVGLTPVNAKTGDRLEYTSNCGSVFRPDPLENERPSTHVLCHELRSRRTPLTIGLIALSAGIVLGAGAARSPR